MIVLNVGGLTWREQIGETIHDLERAALNRHGSTSTPSHTGRLTGHGRSRRERHILCRTSSSTDVNGDTYAARRE